MPDDLTTIFNIVQSQYLAEQHKMRDILEAEAALRLKLAQLDTARVDAARDLSTAQTMHQIGADVLWRAWQDKTRRELNQDLARILAQKLPKQAALKKAFGRKMAVQEMLDQQERDRKLAKIRRFEDRLHSQL